MIDLEFYLKVADLKKDLRTFHNDPAKLLEYLEMFRSSYPVVYNIETTNACNMTCPFCPRTELMTRPVKTMSPDMFRKIISQLSNHPEELWNEWKEHAKQTYGIDESEQSENAFFLYVIPKVIILHGFGDPLLDPHIAEYVRLLTEKGIESYFSCNPANIRLDRTKQVFENGLNYIKYSIDSLTDSVRGKDAFEKDYPQIMKVLEMDHDTQVVICMVNLGLEQFEDLKEKFKDTGVYIYQKSLDQAWMLGKEAPQSIHWSEPCQFPWSSMTIKSNGDVASCSQDYNNELVFGNVEEQTLEEIWNDYAYNRFRAKHVYNVPGIRCTDYGKCDMTTIGKFI